MVGPNLHIPGITSIVAGMPPAFTTKEEILSHDADSTPWLYEYEVSGDELPVSEVVKHVGVGDVTKFASYFPTFKQVEDEFKGSSCAVVANSPRLLRKGLGKVIDGFTHIIRIGQSYSTSGFEEDMGARTTVRWFVFGQEVGQSNSIIQVHHSLQNRYTGPWAYLESFVGIHQKSPEGTGHVWYASPNASRHVHRFLWKRCPDFAFATNNGYPTTGFTAIFAAIRECDTVDVFGFGGPMHGGKHEFNRPMSSEAGTDESEDSESNFGGLMFGKLNPKEPRSQYHIYACERSILSDLAATNAIRVWS